MIKVYSSINCTACEQLINMLKAHNVQYEVLKVEDHYEDVLKYNIRSVPCMKKEGEFLLGVPSEEQLLKFINV